MDMQDPEEQRLEDEPMEPAEGVIEPSDEPVLSDTDASESDELPVPITSVEDKFEDVSVDEEADEESVPETPLGDAAPLEEELETTSEQDDDSSAWFVVHCYSGYENKVRHNLEQRIETMGMKDMIFDVVVPTQEEIEVRDGTRGRCARDRPVPRCRRSLR